MGKHSSNRQWPFYRSLVAWILPWVLLATVIVGASWATVRAMGGSELETDPPERPAATVAESTPEPSPSPAAEDEPEAEPTPKDGPEAPKREGPKRDGPKKLITQGISVQVLNATSVTGAAARMGDRLSDLGFRVVSVDRASVAYDTTTVFWSFAESKRAARRLAERFGWESGPKPRNLSTTVDIHVIVGSDEV